MSGKHNHCGIGAWSTVMRCLAYGHLWKWRIRPLNWRVRWGLFLASADSYLWVAWLFGRFCRQDVSPSFLWAKVPRDILKPPWKSRAQKSSKLTTTRITDTFLLLAWPSDSFLEVKAAHPWTRAWRSMRMKSLRVLDWFLLVFFIDIILFNTSCLKNNAL